LPIVSGAHWFPGENVGSCDLKSLPKKSQVLVPSNETMPNTLADSYLSLRNLIAILGFARVLPSVTTSVSDKRIITFSAPLSNIPEYGELGSAMNSACATRPCW